METRGDLIRPCDLYEWAFKACLEGNLPRRYEDKILENLKSLEWIKRKFDTLPKVFLESMYHSIVESIKDNTMPPDIMSISCMYYYFNMIGIDTSELRELINSSKYIQRAFMEMQAAKN